MPWYQDIGFSYNAQASNLVAKVHQTIDSVKMNIGGVDTIGSVDDFAQNRGQSLSQSASLSLSLTYSKQILGEDLVGKQMVMNFNLGNVLEMKTAPSEEGKEGNKIQLLNL